MRQSQKFTRQTTNAEQMRVTSDTSALGNVAGHGGKVEIIAELDEQGKHIVWVSQMSNFVAPLIKSDIVLCRKSHPSTRALSSDTKRFMPT